MRCVGYMYKKDIIAEAQNDCDCEMKSNALQHYAGWSSMRTLVEKQLVLRKNCPAKFSLTDAGFALAISLYEGKFTHQSNDEESGSTNSSTSLPSTSKSNASNSQSKSGGSKLSDENSSNQDIDIVNSLDDCDDDVFEQNNKVRIY